MSANVPIEHSDGYVRVKWDRLEIIFGASKKVVYQLKISPFFLNRMFRSEDGVALIKTSSGEVLKNHNRTNNTVIYLREPGATYSYFLHGRRVFAVKTTVIRETVKDWIYKFWKNMLILFVLSSIAYAIWLISLRRQIPPDLSFG